MKKILYITSVFLLLLLFGYWYMFIKSKDLKWAGYVGLCLNKNDLGIDLRESAQYFSGYEKTNVGDTIVIEIKTTTVLNHFCKPVSYYHIKLDPNIKYIKIADSVIAVNKIRNCE